MGIGNLSSCCVLSDLSGLIAFYHFFPSLHVFIFLLILTWNTYFASPTSCSSIVLSFHPSLFPINCSVFAFVLHFLLLQTEMEEDPQNKENKVKQGTASDSLIPKTASCPLTGTGLFIEPQHPESAVHDASYLKCTVAWKWVRLVTERVSCLICASLGVVSVHKIMKTVV